jgi:hypothetical protein
MSANLGRDDYKGSIINNISILFKSSYIIFQVSFFPVAVLRLHIAHDTGRVSIHLTSVLATVSLIRTICKYERIICHF